MVLSLIKRRQKWHFRNLDTVPGTSATRGPKDHINIRILQTMISGIPLILGLGTRMSDPYVYVVLWAPNNHERPRRAASKNSSAQGPRAVGASTSMDTTVP